MADSKELRAGFTGTPVVKGDGIKEKAKTAAALVKDEATAVGTSAVDHPQATATLLVAVSAIAFGIGYLLGHSAGEARRPRYWR